MKTITLATALLLLALATRANATTIIFNDGHQWIGTLEPNPPFAFPLFSVFIGECVRSVDCLYNGQHHQFAEQGSLQFDLATGLCTLRSHARAS